MCVLSLAFNSAFASFRELLHLFCWLRTVEDVTRIKVMKSTVTEVLLNGSKAIHVDKRMIEGPNPNDKGKILIPLIALLQYLFIVKPMIRAMKRDIGSEGGLAFNPIHASAERKAKSPAERRKAAVGRKY
ncbi:hypothetical protein SLEP1_g37917 [Rubroshorea leprosula]|uniref:Uncharacterized protein n=1 Tax=Rubroshorea leprosula TaxID=152421 RepID=A0AAV5KWR8_9ROSI|nr:hypothetical protein SLEP1_g37917 [Rubroshorea leprosula]